MIKIIIICRHVQDIQIALITCTFHGLDFSNLIIIFKFIERKSLNAVTKWMSLKSASNHYNY